MLTPRTAKNIFSRFAKGLLCASITTTIVACCLSDDEDASRHALDYGDASAYPKADGMIFWTRITPGSESPDEITVTWEVAKWSNDESMSNVVASGTTTTDSSQNYTVKVDTDGLAANQRYNYHFRVGDSKSLVGHTGTLPSADADVSELKFAVFSCANLPKGYFYSYAHAADQTTNAGDIDAVIHLGDYLYEYDSSGYPYSSGKVITIQTQRCSARINN